MIKKQKRDFTNIEIKCLANIFGDEWAIQILKRQEKDAYRRAMNVINE